MVMVSARSLAPVLRDKVIKIHFDRVVAGNLKDFINFKILSQMNSQVTAAALATGKRMSSSDFSQHVKSVSDL